LLARYVLVVEGRTEFDALPAAARRLCELEPAKFKTLEHLGVAIINAEGETNVAPLGEFFKGLGKTVFAVFDKQTPGQLATIAAAVDHAYESQSKGFEDLVLGQIPETPLRAYALEVVTGGGWPPHMAGAGKTPTGTTPLQDLRNYLKEFFHWGKGEGSAADLLASCTTPAEMPQYVRDTLAAIALIVEPPLAAAAPVAAAIPAVSAAAPGAIPAVSATGGVAAMPAGDAVPASTPAPAAHPKFVPKPPQFNQ
jgi:putative ATP-dependent endonuclease of OLD family